MYEKIKKQNGEAFAKEIRKHAPAALECENIVEILKHAGRDPRDVLKISSALHKMCIPETQDNKEPDCPLNLLDKAGYDAYIVTDRESQDAIKKYFTPDEKLCTFGTDRWKNYKIINAVKKNVGDIERQNFKNPERDDEYGTSVISIQVTNGFISIKNRYNHKVKNCDATFGNDLDSIINGLKAAVEHKFNIKIGAGKTPDGFMIAEGRLLKVNQEINGIYYGDNAIIKNGELIEMKKGEEFLYEYFIFSLSDKMLRKFDDKLKDSFADDFNRYYGGKKSLRVSKNGHLYDGDVCLIEVAA